MTKYYSVAMRGRYDSDNKIKQRLETRWDEIANAITTINTDSMVLIVATRQNLERYENGF